MSVVLLPSATNCPLKSFSILHSNYPEFIQRKRREVLLSFGQFAPFGQTLIHGRQYNEQNDSPHILCSSWINYIHIFFGNIFTL